MFYPDDVKYESVCCLTYVYPPVSEYLKDEISLYNLCFVLPVHGMAFNCPAVYVNYHE